MTEGKFQPARYRGGRLQAAVPKCEPNRAVRRAHGLNLRGVVLKLFPRDTPPQGTGADVAATYASVLVYGRQRVILPRVQITQPVGSLHTGTVGGLRGTTMSTAGTFDPDHSDPFTLDGSHVVVSFLDDDLGQPYISAILEHPRADGGGSITGDVQDRTRLSSEDGRPLLTRWNGVTWGVTGNGDFLVDLENAHNGELLAQGAEPAPLTDPARTEGGFFHVNLPVGAKLTVGVGGGETITIDRADGDARLVLGDGAMSAAIAEHMRDLYESLTDYLYNQFVVLTSFGPSGTAAAAAAPQPPAWDAAIVSTKLKLPDT